MVRFATKLAFRLPHHSRALLALAARRDEAALAEIHEGLRSHEALIEYVCLDPQFRGLFHEPNDRPCAELQSWIQSLSADR